MTARVRALPFDEYQAWFDRQAADNKIDRVEAAKQRAEINKQESTTQTP
jgi:heme/copper-type cytochrome/quinol oxidase subunit 2